MGFGGFMNRNTQAAFLSNSTFEESMNFINALSVIDPGESGLRPDLTPEKAQGAADKFFELRPDQAGKLPSGKPVVKAPEAPKKEGDPVAPLTAANRNLNSGSRGRSTAASRSEGSVSQVQSTSKRGNGNGSSVTALGASTFKKTLLGE